MARIIRVGTANLPGASTGMNVCLYDYGFVDFQENGVITEDLQADFVNLTFPKSDVISNYEQVMGSLPGTENQSAISVSKGGHLFNNQYGYTDMGTFNESGSMSHQHGNTEWQFVPSAYNIYEYGMQDDVPSNQPFHGDFVVSQFASQLDQPVADQSHLFLIDVDFGDDLSALMSSGSGSVINDIFESFLDGESYQGNPDNTLYPIFGMTASFGGLRVLARLVMKYNFLPSSPERFFRLQQMQTKAVTIGQQTQIMSM